MHQELQLKDEEMIGPIIDKLEKVTVRGGGKKLKPECDTMCKVKSLAHFKQVSFVFRKLCFKWRTLNCQTSEKR